MRGGDGRMRLRVSVWIRSVENELRGDETRARSLIVTARSDEIYKNRLIPKSPRR